MIVHPHGSVVFCDDTRQENTGKLIFIGVYQNVMIFEGPPPWLWGGLWCHVRYSEPFPTDKLPPMTITITRRDEGSETQVLASMSLPEVDLSSVPPLDDSMDLSKDGLRLFHTGAAIRLGSMEFDRPARIRAIMKRGDEDIFLGSLMIHQRPEN